MIKEKWNTEPSKEYMKRCLCTFVNDMKERWVGIGWTSEGEMMQGAIAWMEIPEHASKNPEGWFSQYRGDEFPKEGRYLVSMMHEFNHDLPYGVHIQYFNPTKETFGGSTAFIAWRQLPKEYNG